MKLIEILRSLELHKLSILDACTGTGCIPLLLKKELAATDISAIDLSDRAIALADKNRRNCSLDITLLKDDVLSPTLSIPTALDLVVSNPPYIPEHDFDKPLLLNGPDLSVRRYEPHMALIGNLEFYRALVVNFVIPYKSKGLFFELGYEKQVAETVKHLPPNWSHGRYFDLAGNLRGVVAWLNGSIMESLQLLINE